MPFRITHRKQAKRRAKETSAAGKEPVPVTLPPLSDREEIALAILLWKSLRCHGALTDGGTDGRGGRVAGQPTYESVAHGNRAMRLAKLAGVQDEFFALLFSTRLVKVTYEVME